MVAAAAMGFGDRVAELVAARQSQLVVGLDPDPARLWPRAIELAGGPGSSPAQPEARAALAVTAHCALVIEAVREHSVAVKLQVACFERLGAAGWVALREVVQRAKQQGLLVIADAKRGDIDVSAGAYAQTFFGQTPTVYGAVQGLGVDALTVNPLLGADSLAPFVASARQAAGGLFLLVRTSNPGAAEIQDRELAEGGAVSDLLAGMVSDLGKDAVGASGLSDIGAVVAATAPERLAPLRELMPHAVFLLPGIGAQGGDVQSLAPAFNPGPGAALISASRSIVGAHEDTGGDPLAAASREAARLRELAWSVARGG